jgi:dTDP-4-amino-4,6-dideoxygalactose transaminase
MTEEIRIPLMRPKLPGAEALLPYLEEIDRARWYTNSGPLLTRFEARLEDHFGVPKGAIVCVANGTLALLLALKAVDAPEGSLCVMPAWTFVATAVAVTAAGLTPWLVDVEEESWSIEPRTIKRLLADAPGAVGAVLPVAPFGAPMKAAPWERFQAETQIPVVRDMATAFDTLEAGDAPSAVSLHATKVFGVGEGGFVATRSGDLARRLRSRRNYGFETGARVTVAGLNAKTSEYAAAVGLAAMDGWPERRKEILALTKSYRERIDALDGVSPSPSFGDGWCGATCSVRLERGNADDAIAQLRVGGIEARKWWGEGCHNHPAYGDCPRTALPITERLAASVLGLPFYPGIGEAEIDAVCDVLRRLS